MPALASCRCSSVGTQSLAPAEMLSWECWQECFSSDTSLGSRGVEVGVKDSTALPARSHPASCSWSHRHPKQFLSSPPSSGSCLLSPSDRSASVILTHSPECFFP